MGARILVVDDEKNIRSTLRICLEALGHTVFEAATGEAALAAIKQHPFELAFVDLRIGTESGLALLPKLIAADTSIDVILITAYATFDVAVEAVKRGARDFLPKPFTPAQIRHLVDKSLEQRQLYRRVGELEDQLSQLMPDVSLESSSPKMQAVMALLTRAAGAEATVLFRGESGTGKGLLARTLHQLSARKLRPFVTINCPTLTEQLLASELFGHARGAFTGAVRDQPGRVEQAEGGTLFLDEVAEMSPALQAQLLRFVQEKQFERLGEGKTRTADVRVLSATNKNLELEVTEGRFREDLLYRLNVIEVAVPPLRERPEDILPLVRRFLAFFARANKRTIPELTAGVEELLQSYPWPGNVRELRNAIERALIVWPTNRLEPQAFPEKIAMTSKEGAVALGGPFSLEQLEREHVLRILASTPSLDEAARVLGVDASTLYRKRKKWDPS